MGEAFITRRGGGGGAGGTLVVTGVAGSTVTATKGDKTYTRTLNSEGKATFKGLASGTWTITMTDGTQTVTRTVTITADYDLTIAYFSATISITYPAASTCVVTDSSGTQVASNTNGDSSAKTWTVTVGSTGTYTITAASADGAKTKSVAVNITTEGQVETVKLVYELVLFDINGWLSKYSTPEMSRMSFESGEGLVAQYHEWGNILCSTVKISEIVDYAELCFDYSITYTYQNYPTFGLNETSTLFGYGVDVAATIVTDIKDGEPGTAVVDISSVKSPYYLRISGNFTGIISKIYLR